MSHSTPFQQTLAAPASLAGTSVHTGEEVKITLLPAPPDHGIKFLRKDLPDEPVVDAKIANVKQVERATTIAEGNVKVHTVEHVLSALCGMEIDNALIEMDANEPPIVDGCAMPFVQLIEQAGIQKQEVPRRVFEVRETIHIETPNGSMLTLVPDKKFRISCTQMGTEGRFCQYFSTEITPEIFKKEIAPARTFVYYEDVKPLMDKGLIKGGSLENAILIRGKSTLSKDALRFEDEFVRHKILDIIGDVSLLGRPIRGHIIAVKPSHNINAMLTRALSKAYADLLFLVPQQKAPKRGMVLDAEEVMRLLPHRFPFLMVDRIVNFEGHSKCTGIKNVTINEPYFAGHFPQHPIMPGVLQLEAMAQVANILMNYQEDNSGRIGYFASADKVKFRKPVWPGDTLFITAELLKARRNLGKATCFCKVNDEVVSQAELMFSLIDK